MKKVFAVFALVGVLAACNNKKKDENTDKMKDTTTTTTTTPPADNNTTTTTTSSNEVPSFSNPEVQKWAQDYAAFVDSYIAAYTSKDATKIAQVSSTAANWGQQTASMLSKLTDAQEATKLSNWLQQQSQRMLDAAKSMTKM